MVKKNYRKHVRLKNYDYSKPGYYFVTTYTNFRKPIFDLRISYRYGHKLPENVVAELALPIDEECRVAGSVVEKELLELTNRFPNLETDFYVFVPTHVHIIFVIKQKVEKITLPRIVQAFKSLSTREAKRALQLPSGVRVW